MKTRTVFMLAILGLSACSKTNQKTEQITSEVLTADSVNLIPASQRKNNLGDIQVGMRDEKVKALLGKPTKVDVLVSELGARMEDWWYGKNQKVRITGGQVTRIVKDVAQEQETLVRIREAKERGDDAEAKRLIDEMSANN